MPNFEDDDAPEQPRSAPNPVPRSQGGVVPGQPRRSGIAIPGPGSRPPSAGAPAARPGGVTSRPPAPRSSMGGGGAPRQAPKFFPEQPRSIQEAGLTTSMVEELILKALFFAGEMRGSDIANRLKLAQLIVDDVIEGLRRSKYIDLKGGAGLGVGKSGMIFTLTTFATDLIKQILERNRYNGPAPVRLEEYAKAVNAQTVRGMKITKSKMTDRFGDLVVKDYVFDGLGPAMNSGKAIFFYGAPGNGKTALCQALVSCYDGDIYIPHAILVDDFIIKVFDPILHTPVPDDPNAPASDARWVRCRRPLVTVGGELTLEMLDLMYSPDVKYYEAPFQLKASNGMLLVDDFGRQVVSPKALLNRWIVPLESEVDYLTLHTGKKLQVPFNVFVAFSTNLDPGDLVDDAFLRRVRYKLAVQPPDEEQFHAIWEVVCRKNNVAYDAGTIDWLIDTHYRPTNRPFAACQPRDLLGQVIDIAHYRGQPPALSEDLLDTAVANYFVKFDKPGAD